MSALTHERELLSVVSPVYCEEETIGTFLERLVKELRATATRHGMAYEVVLVNDGSTDRSLEIMREFALQDPCIRILNLSRNFGHQVAITAGIDHALGDCVVVLDSDLQDPPEAIADMVERWNKGYKVVYGVRGARGGEGRFKILTARWFYRLMNLLSDVDMPLDAGDFRLMDRAVVEVLKEMREENRYLRGMVAWVGFEQCAVEYDRDPRHGGETKYTLRRMVRLAMDGLTSFSERPLRAATQLGFAVTALALLWIVFIVADNVVNADAAIRGWRSLMATILFLGGVQLLSVGVVGSYLGRVYRETKRRPLYVVSDRVNFDADTE